MSELRARTLGWKAAGKGGGSDLHPQFPSQVLGFMPKGTGMQEGSTSGSMVSLQACWSSDSHKDRDSCRAGLEAGRDLRTRNRGWKSRSPYTKAANMGETRPQTGMSTAVPRLLPLRIGRALAYKLPVPQTNSPRLAQPQAGSKTVLQGPPGAPGAVLVKARWVWTSGGGDPVPQWHPTA